MGEYKDKHGKTRLGDILSKVAKSLPNLADDVLNIVTSTNPIGAALWTLKDKLSSISTGNVGDELLKEINDLSENDLKEYEMYLKDIQGARNMYVNTGHEQADKIAENIMKRNLPYIVIMASVNVLVLLFAETFDLSTAVVLAVGNVIGMVIQSLINERAQVVGFYMGSSIGSKLKDKAKSLFN